MLVVITLVLSLLANFGHTAPIVKSCVLGDTLICAPSTDCSSKDLCPGVLASRSIYSRQDDFGDFSGGGDDFGGNSGFDEVDDFGASDDFSNFGSEDGFGGGNDPSPGDILPENESDSEDFGGLGAPSPDGLGGFDSDVNLGDTSEEPSDINDENTNSSANFDGDASDFDNNTTDEVDAGQADSAENSSDPQEADSSTDASDNVAIPTATISGDTTLTTANTDPSATAVTDDASIPDTSSNNANADDSTNSAASATPTQNGTAGPASNGPQAQTSAADGSCAGGGINAATVNLIKEFEGFVPSPAPDPIGLPTVGFGHLCKNAGCSEVPFSFPLSQGTAASLLQADVKQFVSCVNTAVSNAVSLNDNQVGALTAFSFNVGCGALKSSTLVKRLNAGDDPNTVAAQELPKFNKAGGKVLAGLTRRRAAEVTLFQTASPVQAHPCT